MRPRNILFIVSGTALILLIPLIAMQFTSEVDWNLFDFVVIGVLLLGSGFIYELLASRISKPENRLIIGFVMAVLVFLIWAELAVGIFGSPFAGS